MYILSIECPTCMTKVSVGLCKCGSIGVLRNPNLGLMLYSNTPYVDVYYNELLGNLTNGIHIELPKTNLLVKERSTTYIPKVQRDTKLSRSLRKLN